jgi:hypothetical protein
LLLVLGIIHDIINYVFAVVLLKEIEEGDDSDSRASRILLLIILMLLIYVVVLQGIADSRVKSAAGKQGNQLRYSTRTKMQNYIPPVP